MYVAATELYWTPVVNHDANARLPPIVILLLIPIPPVTTKVPVVVDVDAVPAVNVVAPATLKLLNVPIVVIDVCDDEANTPFNEVAVTVDAFIVPLTPIPPVTINVPVVVVVESVPFENLTIPPALIAPLTPIPPVTINVPFVVVVEAVPAAKLTIPALLIAPLIPKPPVITKAPVVDVVDAVLSPNNILPAGTHNAYLLVRVILAPTAGAFAIYTVDAFVIVAAVTADIVLIPNEFTTPDANVLVLLQVNEAPLKFDCNPVVLNEATVRLLSNDNPCKLLWESVPVAVIDPLVVIELVAVIVLPHLSSPPIPTPPVTTKAPVVDDTDAVLSPNNILPFGTHKA